MANAAQELSNTVGFTWQGFNSAANYTLQNNVNLEQGLKWADQAIAQNNTFAPINTKAAILMKMGKKDEADQLIAAALPNATEAEINAYGYQLLNNGNIDKAIEVLTLNTKRFPKSPNTWDSLGEIYFNKGDQKNAIANFKKSLSMNPPAAVRANSEKFLKQMNAM
jgi:tetratricopeptide (TPR) repeat protein